MQRKFTVKPSGFTLIELMIVVAIIGVLSAIGVPAYQNYVAKSELATGLATLKSLLTPAELYWQENGSLADFTQYQDNSPLGEVSAPQTNTLQFTFDQGSLNGSSILYTRQDSGWQCSVNLASDLTLDIPQSCADNPQ